MFPAAWTRNPEFAVNLQLAALWFAGAWCGFAFASTGFDLSFADPDGPFLTTICVLGVAAIAVPAVRLLGLAPDAAIAAIAQVVLGVACGILLDLSLWGFQPSEGLIVVIGILAVATPLANGPLARFGIRYKKGGAERLALESGITGGSASRLLLAIVHFLRGLRGVFELFELGVYSTWSTAATTIARSIRLAPEPRSVVCREKGCGQIFDDPPLRCRCGQAGLRSFPRLFRPVLAYCPSCRSTYPSWKSFERLTRAGVRLCLPLCKRACQERISNERRPRQILCIAMDGPPFFELIRLVRPVIKAVTRHAAHDSYSLSRGDRHVNLALYRSARVPRWAADWDSVLIIPRQGENAATDVQTCLDRIMLPQRGQTWSSEAAPSSRGWMARLTSAPQGDPPPTFNSRVTPELAVVTPLAQRETWPQFTQVAPQRDAIEEFLWRS